MNKYDILNELVAIQNYETPIVRVSDSENNLFVKKEDVIPFSFGGNKCRIAASYYKKVISQESDVVITYGSSSSNLCRVIANMAARYGQECVIISPEENYIPTPNSEMVSLLGAKIIKSPLDKVADTIERVISDYKKEHNPFFIYGGGHGVLGTESYRCVLNQIVSYEKNNGITFDYIFITLATGTSMSGLIIENEMKCYGKKIIGVSVARELDRALDIMKKALYDFDSNISKSIKADSYEILGDYRDKGYGSYSPEVLSLIKKEFVENGLNLDTTYTGKAFFGMKDYLTKRNILNKNILFIHTGGTPLFFKDNCNYLNNT